MSISRGIYNELIYRIGENMGITCILILIIIVLIAVIIGYKREFRRISKQINNNLDEYANIKTKSVDKDIEYLVENINLIFDSKQRIVAEKNKNEEELRASIANMSHDLRTPLTSIMGYLQMARLEEVSEEEKNEYNFNYKKVNLKNILCENIAAFYNDFINNNINPIIEVDENIRDIISDEGAITRIFTNLIGNIIKHGESYVKITLKQKDDVIITEFINKTTDLTEENVDKLFKRFYTVDKSRSDRNTGLGLYITKVLVEKLGYSINSTLKNEELIIQILWK